MSNTAYVFAGARQAWEDDVVAGVGDGFCRAAITPHGRWQRQILLLASSRVSGDVSHGGGRAARSTVAHGCRLGDTSGPALGADPASFSHRHDSARMEHGGRRGGASTRPYLARQMSDSGLRRPKKGSNSGAFAKNSTSQGD